MKCYNEGDVDAISIEFRESLSHIRLGERTRMHNNNANERVIRKQLENIEKESAAHKTYNDEREKIRVYPRVYLKRLVL